MEKEIVCPNCSKKNPPWKIFCLECNARLKGPAPNVSSEFPERKIFPSETPKKGILPNETFETISTWACVILAALLLPIILLMLHVYEWRMILWFLGFLVYYRVLYEVYLSYVVRDESRSIWWLILAGMVTGIVGGVVLATLWDIIRLVLRLILRPVEPFDVHFFWATALKDSAIS